MVSILNSSAKTLVWALQVVLYPGAEGGGEGQDGPDVHSLPHVFVN